MQLKEFHLLVNESIKRGNTFDTLIPVFTKQAAQKIETRENYVYMRGETSVILSNGNSDYTFTTALVKKLNSIYITETDGTRTFLRNLDPIDVETVVTEKPLGFWLNGFDSSFNLKIQLTAICDEDYTGKATGWFYTSWPTTDSATNFILERGPMLLLAETIVLMAPIVKNPELLQTWIPIHTIALKDFNRAMDELESMLRHDVMEPE